MFEVYAHRGGRGLAPENTIPAYKSALRQGIDYVDMDINMTKDGVLMVTHDFSLNPNITRNAQGQFIKKPIPIYQLTYKQVESYNVGKHKAGTTYASFFPMQFQMKDVKIPTLKHVIDYVKSIAGNKVGFQIEIKTDATHPKLTASPKAYAAALDKVLRQEHIVNRTEVQAFDFKCLQALQKIDPQVKTAYLTDHIDEPSTGKNKDIWMAGHDIKNFHNSYPDMVKALGGACWEPYEVDLTRAELKRAHKLGLKVVVWGWPEVEGTAFNYPLFKKLIAWHIDGIITDRPDELRGILSARGYQLPLGFLIN